MRSYAVKNGAEGVQDGLRELAQEVLSEILKIDPAHSKELLGDFVAELFLSVAEQERREVRRQKQAEGIAAAKARGVQFGRAQKPLPENFIQYYEAWQGGQMTAAQASEACGISKGAFYRAADRVRQSENRPAL